MTTKLAFVGTPAQVFAATRSHWADLGLDAAPIDALEATLSVSGSLAYARAGTVELFGHTNDVPPLVDLYVPDADAHLWRSPLASTETMVVHATRGDLTVPVLEGAGLPRPQTPRYVTAGHVLPVEAPNGDAPHVDEWEQRLPGVADGYALGEMVARGDKVWLQTLPGGNYNEPGTGGVTGWITRFADTEPMWETGNVYTQPLVVRWPNDGAGGPLHRYTLMTTSENSAAGREPHHAYMWAVWDDIGAAP